MTQTKDLAILLSQFDEPTTLATLTERLSAGEDPLALIEECRRGMQIVGDKFEQGVYFLSALIMAGEIMREVLEIVGPRMSGDLSGDSLGTMLLCTVKGDVHDVGKDIAATLLEAHGLRIVDLGVDVGPQRVADEVLALQPDIVGLSGLLTEAFESMKNTVAAIRACSAPSGRHIPVILGGGRLTQKVCDFAAADAWCTNAGDGVRLVKELLQPLD